MSEIWDRQTGESARAFEAFSEYRDHGPGRSLSKVAQKLNKSKQLLGRWSVTYSWVKRCQSYDTQADSEARSERRTRRRAMLDQATEKVDGMTGKLDPATFDPSSMDAMELIDAMSKLTGATAKLCDQSRIEYSDLPAQKIQHSGPNGGPIVTKDARQKLLAKIKIYSKDEGQKNDSSDN